eukprot:349679-Chlamydomonas_euryale.AAC.15
MCGVHTCTVVSSSTARFLTCKQTTAGLLVCCGLAVGSSGCRALMGSGGIVCSTDPCWACTQRHAHIRRSTNVCMDIGVSYGRRCGAARGYHAGANTMLSRRPGEVAT